LKIINREVVETMSGEVFLNGRYCAPEEALVSVDDRGFLFGDGIYEAIRYFEGKLFRLQEHLARLERSAKKILLSLPYGAPEIAAICHELLLHSGSQYGLIYLQVTRGAAPRTHQFPGGNVTPTFLARIIEVDEASVLARRRGIKVIFAPDQRWGHCDIKSLNLLPNVLAREAAYQQGAYEAVFVHPLGITECGSSNVFAVIDGKLVTAPQGDHILPGIIRETVLELAAAAGLAIELRYPRQEEFAAAAEIFITNSLDEIAPVLALDGKEVSGGHPGPITLLLQEKLEELKETV
jgi:D-alanine transaminase